MSTSIQTWKVELHLFDHDDSTTADAVLTTHAGTRVHGHGRARRNPADPMVPEIGEELAAARALRHLADRLLETASTDIAELEHTDVHLVR